MECPMLFRHSISWVLELQVYITMCSIFLVLFRTTSPQERRFLLIECLVKPLFFLWWVLRPCSSRKIPWWHSSVLQPSPEHYWGRVAALILTVGDALRPNTLTRVQTICSETHLKEYSPNLLSSQNDREVSPMILQQYGYPNMSWRNTPPINILTWGGHMSQGSTSRQTIANN